IVGLLTPELTPFFRLARAYLFLRQRFVRRSMTLGENTSRCGFRESVQRTSRDTADALIKDAWSLELRSHGKLASSLTLPELKIPPLAAPLTTGLVQECSKDCLQEAPPWRSSDHGYSIRNWRR